MLYKRGSVWWYAFIFNGSRIRESSHTDSKTIARQLELKRRRDLELAVGGIKRERPLRFRVAARQWFSTKTSLSVLGLRYYGRLFASWISILGTALSRKLMLTILPLFKVSDRAKDSQDGK